MKRSDFIKQAAEILHPKIENELGTNLTPYGTENLLEMVLSEFENQGISPPEYEGETYDSQHAHIGLEESKNGKVLHRAWETE